MLLVLPDLVIFCPLPPKPNGIADYLAEQLPYFAKKLRVCVVIENTAPKPAGIPNAVSVLRLAEYLSLDAHMADIPHLYHVGNNPDTQYMLPVLLNRSGIVMVHDLNLHYLIDLTNLSLGDKRSYKLSLFNQYGSAGKVLGDQLEKYNWKGAHMPHELRMNKSIIQAASQVIVHSEYSKNAIGAEGHNNVSVIPHHLSPEMRQHQPKMKMTYRGELGLPGDRCVITSMGFIAKAKQIKAVLASLSELKARGQKFTYILAGQCKQHEYDVFQDIADYNLQDDVIVTGYLSAQDFFKYLIASDFIVNLRYPTGGESSGTLTRAFGLGLGCIVVNIGPFAEIPDECAIKLDFDEQFSDNLTNALAELITKPHKRVELGLNARRWVESSHDISLTTDAYLKVVQAEKQRLSTPTEHQAQSPSLLPTDANTQWCDYLCDLEITQFIQNNQQIIAQNKQAANLWWRNSCLPLVGQARLLYISDWDDDLTLATRLLEVQRELVHQVSAESVSTGVVKPIALPCERFLVVLPVRLIEADPVKVFAVINSLLAMGAIGCVSLVWDAPVRPEVLIERKAMRDYFEAAGFSIDKVITGQVEIDMPDTQLEHTYQQEWCFALTKRSNTLNLNPQPYYPGVCSKLASSRSVQSEGVRHAK